MKKLLYKKGYLVRVTSWENDADNYNNKEINVTTEEQAKEIVELCKLFERCWHDKPPGVGNISHMSRRDHQFQLLKDTILNFHRDHPNFFDEAPNREEYYFNWYMDFIRDLGLSGSEDFLTRVCEKVEVFKFDDDVYCEEVKF